MKKKEREVNIILEEYPNIKLTEKEISKICEELSNYKKIGTVEDFTRLKRKEEPRKLVWTTLEYKCPYCGNMEIGKEKQFAYCPNCGQKLDRLNFLM